jgi:hypothetical protein
VLNLPVPRIRSAITSGVIAPKNARAHSVEQLDADQPPGLIGERVKHRA